MPFFHVPPELAEEYAEFGGDDFDPATLPGATDPDRVVDGKGFAFGDEFVEGDRFNPAGLTGIASLVLDRLRKREVTAVRVKYDGGYEGFAHFDAALTPDGEVPAKTLVEEWAAVGFADDVRALPAADGQTHAAEYLRGLKDDARVVDAALFEIADAVAGAMLTDGFGTGEYEMFGAILADLTIGALTDLRDAEPPENGGVV